MRIKDIAILELFLETVCEASDGRPLRDEPEAGRLAVAGPEAAAPTSLAEQLGNRENMLEHLADRYEAEGLVKLAVATRRLASALEDGDLLSSDDQERQRRLLDYVYPVV